MNVVAGTWQLLFTLKVVAVKFIAPRSVTVHSLPHREMDALFAKCWVLLVGIGRRRGNLFSSLVLKTIDVELIHIIATESD